MPRRTQTCSTPRACRRSAAARTASTVSATGWPTRAASSSTFGVTVCTRTEPSNTGAAAVALATLTGSNTERTPASCAAESSQRMTVASRFASTTRASAPPSRVGTTARSATAQLVGGAHVGDRDVQVAAVVEHGGVGAGGVRRDDDVPALDARGGWCAAATVSPAGSSPTAATSTVGRPSRARFSAMLRPTPPTVAEAVPGLLVPSTGAAAVRTLVSSTAPPTTTHRAGLGPHDVAAAQHDALAGEVAQVHRHGRPGGADPLGERRGIQQRVGAQQVDDLALAGGQVHVVTIKDLWEFKQQFDTVRTGPPRPCAGPRCSGSCAGHAGDGSRWLRRDTIAAPAPASARPARMPAPTCRYLHGVVVDDDGRRAGSGAGRTGSGPRRRGSQVPLLPSRGPDGRLPVLPTTRAMRALAARADAVRRAGVVCDMAVFLL